MRYIRKGTEPEELTRQRQLLAATPGVDDYYEALPGSTKDAVRAQCLQEQANLCAYTMIRIDADRTHLEHMYPRRPESSSPQDRLEAVDYSNIVACYPGPGDDHPRFGAVQKSNWPAPHERYLFLRPTVPTVEERLRFEKDGRVSPSSSGDQTATVTIQRLDLNHRDLVHLRRSAIEEPLLDARLSTLRAIRARLRRLEEFPEEYDVAKRQLLQRRRRQMEARRQGIRGRSGGAG